VRGVVWRGVAFECKARAMRHSDWLRKRYLRSGSGYLDASGMLGSLKTEECKVGGLEALPGPGSRSSQVRSTRVQTMVAGCGGTSVK
jgi:hypothetical protein